MWPFTKENKNINPSNAQTIHRYEWIGIEPLKLLEFYDRKIITARLTVNPEQHIGKYIVFNRKKYRIKGVEWGKSGKKICGLIVE